MKEVAKRRNRWYVSDGKGSTKFFKSEEEAKIYAGHTSLCKECDCSPCECTEKPNPILEEQEAKTNDVNINIGNNIDFGKGNIF